MVISQFQYMLLLRGATALAINTQSQSKFQYMLLLRGATELKCTVDHVKLFQYMLLLRGATAHRHRIKSPRLRFNTCSSCEEQQLTPLLPLVS